MSRIISYEEKTELASDDYLLIDGSTDGTKKIKASLLVDSDDIALLNYRSGSFTVTSGGHSSSKDRIYIQLEEGDTYYVTVTSTIPSMVYQIFEYDSNGSNIKNGTNRSVGTEYKLTALTGVQSIGIYCGAQSSAYTLTVLIEKGGSVFKQISGIQNNVGTLSDKIDNLSKGVDIEVNYSKAEDGKNYGYRYFTFPFFKGQKIVVSNAQQANNNWTCVLRDENDAELLRFSVIQNETKTVYVPSDGGVRLGVYLNSYPMLGRIVAESMDDYQNRIIDSIAGATGNTTDIVGLNYTVPETIKYAQKLVYGQSIVPFSLIHFSDPHGGKTNVTRLLQMRNALGTLIDDIICTGDMVTNKYADGYSWWDEIDGSETILTCIGNHDVSNGEVYTEYGITREQAYNTYFAPYIGSWNVTHSGSLTYWYKDYADKKIRLIALDYLLSGDEAAAQNTWLQNALADAKSNDYTVVIAQHCQLSSFQKINSNFTMIDPKTPYQYPTIYQESVQAYMNNGGKFACYIAGHTHWDMLCINPDYPNQICITVTCTAQTGRDNDQIRETGTKSQDAANVITIDTTNQTVKLIRIGADKDNYLRGRNRLVFSYADKTIISES